MFFKFSVSKIPQIWPIISVYENTQGAQHVLQYLYMEFVKNLRQRCSPRVLACMWQEKRNSNTPSSTLIVRHSVTRPIQAGFIFSAKKIQTNMRLQNAVFTGQIEFRVDLQTEFVFDALSSQKYKAGQSTET